MECLAVLEAVNVKEARLSCLVRYMQCKAPIKTENEEVEVITQSDTCSQCHITEEILQRELGVLIAVLSFIQIVGTVLEVPYITGIQEKGAMEITKQLRTILQVTHKFDVAILHEVRDGFVFITGETARTQSANGEGSYAVGTAHIEQLGIR